MLEPREYYCDVYVSSDGLADAYGVHKGELCGVYRTDRIQQWIVVPYDAPDNRITLTGAEMKRHVTKATVKKGGPLAKGGLKFQPAKEEKRAELPANCWTTDESNVNGHEHYKGRDLMAAVRAVAEATTRKGGGQ